VATAVTSKSASVSAIALLKQDHAAVKKKYRENEQLKSKAIDATRQALVTKIGHALTPRRRRVRDFLIRRAGGD
jgi:hypothetical protein